MKYILCIYLFLVSFGVDICAQNILTKEDKKEHQERVRMKVKEFQQYLSDIVDTKLSDSQRQSSIKSALTLFRGKGEEYSVENEYGEIESRRPVRMELSNVYNQRKRRMTIKRFLKNLCNNIHRYGVVQIQSVDIEEVDSIYKVDSTHYKAIIYQQRYAFGKKGIPPCQTKSGFKYIVDIKPIETPVGIVWDVAKLGDVYVTATRLK